jgi:hypothetical protein
MHGRILGPASGFLPYFGQGPLLEAVFADDFVQPFSFEDSLVFTAN